MEFHRDEHGVVTARFHAGEVIRSERRGITTIHLEIGDECCTESDLRLFAEMLCLRVNGTDVADPIPRPCEIWDATSYPPRLMGVTDGWAEQGDVVAMPYELAHDPSKLLSPDEFDWLTVIGRTHGGVLVANRRFGVIDSQRFGVPDTGIPIGWPWLVRPT